MTYQIGPSAEQDLVSTPLSTLAILSNMQNVSEAADARKDEVTDAIIKELSKTLLEAQNALYASQAENNILRGRIQAFEENQSIEIEQLRKQIDALQEQITALKSRVETDAATIVLLESTIKQKKEKLTNILNTYPYRQGFTIAFPCLNKLFRDNI